MLDEKDIKQLSILLDERLAAQAAAIAEKTAVQNAALKLELQRELEEVKTDFHALTESDIMPKIQLLAEGQQLILNRLTPRSTIESMQEELSILKSAFRLLSE